MMNVTELITSSDITAMDNEELIEQIEFLAGGSVVTEGIAGSLFKAISSFIARILFNIKAKLKFFSTLSRTALTEYLESNAFKFRDVMQMDYTKVYKQQIPVYTWKVKIEDMPMILTEPINKCNPVKSIKETADVMGTIEAALMQNDSMSIVKSCSYLIDDVLMTREVPKMTKDLIKIIDVKKKSNRVEFGKIFKSMNEFEKVILTAKTIDTPIFTQVNEVNKDLDRVYGHMDNMIAVLKKGDRKIDGASIKKLSAVFSALDGFLQLYGSLVKEVNAYEQFLVNCLSSIK